MDRRSEAIAQLLETALSERFATPVTEVIQAIAVPVAIVHAMDLRLLTLNELMAAVLGRPVADAVGRSIVELTPARHPLADPRPYRAVARSEHAFDSSVVIGSRPWQWSIRPLKGLDRAVDHLLVCLVGSTEPTPGPDLPRLLEINATKTEFLNLAAHELRTPLGVIHGYASMLAQGGLTIENQQLAGARIYEKAKQLSRLITDLALVARLDELGPALATDRLDLIELVEPTIEDLQRRYPDLAIEFQFRQPRAPVTGNAYWLQLAIRELLDNAVRFRPAPTGRIDVSVNPTANGWVISVLDDGFGISTTDQGSLFDRFSLIETEENRHLVGMGIGLYMVREVAAAHGGQVGVNSRQGTGSEFTIELPRTVVRRRNS
ncbi:MAG: PAS domain-containing sensor histidine kinase [Candidatus Dormibacteraeota bacterium]|nr:PAS domain-containing sensor histidine kinase [Candidatus Dormibacteraeota bacterium]